MTRHRAAWCDLAQLRRLALASRQQAISFSDWRAGDFAVWGGRVRGTEAAINLLLPLAAVAFGLTGIGIVFLICAHFAH